MLPLLRLRKALELRSVPYLALEKPWWDGRVTKDMAIADKVFFSTGDISILDNECTMVMFFNKELVTDYTLDDPYTLVREKKWTIDKVGEMAAAVTHDVDGDGKMTDADAWGMTAAFNAPISLYFASGERIVDKDADGNWQFGFGTSRRPVSSISNTPISLVEPKRFFAARRMR